MDVALKIVCSYSKKKHTLVILHWSEECRERGSKRETKREECRKCTRIDLEEEMTVDEIN